jgi:type IV pilus assembly protein PilC
LSTFSYLVAGAQGKEKKGTMDAASREEAMETLKHNGDLVISLDEVGLFSKDLEISFLSNGPKPRDLAVFCRQIVSIIDAGVPVVSALEMLSEQTENKKLAKALSACKSTIEKGETLAQAMSERPDIFPSMLITLVSAGEASGSLSVSFARMAEQFEKETKIKETVKKASIYPIVIAIVAFGASVLLLTFVVPTFQTMLSDLGTAMPPLTAFVLSLSDALQHRWYVLFIVIIAAVFGLRYFSKTNTGMHVIGKIALKAPLIGPLTTKTASARMARTLGTLLGSGLPLVDALNIVTKTMTNVYFKEALTSTCKAVTLGSPMSSQFKNDGLFPPLVHHMIGIGEETGSVENMLNKLAEYYEEEVEGATARVMAALEPAIIVFMALIIGTIVIAMVLPMASMYSGLNNM